MEAATAIWIERFCKMVKYEYIYIQPKKIGQTCMAESGDSLMIITITVITITMESTIQCQTSSTVVRLFEFN